MKLCMMSGMLGCAASPETVARTAVDCGMEAVDWITTHDRPPALLRKVCADAGLRISAHTMLKNGFLEGAPDYFDEFKASLEDAVEMGAPVLMVPPFPRKTQVSLEDDRKAWIEYYARALPLARKAGVTLTLESTGMRQSPITSAPEVLQVLQAVPGLMLTFDYGNMRTCEDASDAYPLLKRYIVRFHLKDYRIHDAPREKANLVRCGKYFQDVLIGRGDLDLKGFWNSLDPVDRERHVNLETKDFTGRIPAAEALKMVAAELIHW